MPLFVKYLRVIWNYEFTDTPPGIPGGVSEIIYAIGNCINAEQGILSYE